jgi:hypothetical protein
MKGKNYHVRLMDAEKSIKGGTVSGIIIAASLIAIGFFYPSFTPF